ncbi:PAS domain-containing protein [Altererythrobacter salegens]|uniref:PAS domain-containing protein n=1 Tax=Croceibacterium salegens TaxID=1737568 RepID=A0A6I4SW08_9SPHN|nr:PAS domain-containing protein [Croceibacterium salegens]MXO60304.1 PAS domain-containing protein [Croceibacterium salegens]
MTTSERCAAIVTDPHQPDNPIVECNDQFLKLTGYERHEVIGRNCRFLTGPETDPKHSKLLHDAIAEQRPVVAEIINYRKDGTPFLNSVMIAPIFDADHSLTGFIGSQVDVSSYSPQTFASLREERAKRLAQNLTPRQRDVLSLLARGKPLKQIAFSLGLSERTVKMHRAAMLRSLQVATNAEAIRIAVRADI